MKKTFTRLKRLLAGRDLEIDAMKKWLAKSGRKRRRSGFCFRYITSRHYLLNYFQTRFSFIALQFCSSAGNLL